MPPKFNPPNKEALEVLDDNKQSNFLSQRALRSFSPPYGFELHPYYLAPSYLQSAPVPTPLKDAIWSVNLSCLKPEVLEPLLMRMDSNRLPHGFRLCALPMSYSYLTSQLAFVRLSSYRSSLFCQFLSLGVGYQRTMKLKACLYHARLFGAWRTPYELRQT